MRLGDSPFVLALWGTVAVHALALVAADALVVTNPRQPAAPAPRIEMVDIQIPAPPEPVVQKPAPVVEDKVEDKVEPTVEPAVEPPPQKITKSPPQRVTKTAPRAQETPPPQQPTSPDSGGSPVVQMPDLVPTENGVAVRPGPSNRDQRTGRGGGGKGAGRGSGSSDAPPPPPPPPVSVATIKTKAMPKGDYGFINAARDYPPEARRLGVEGQIKVRLVVDVTGKVTSATLVNRLGHGLDELALAKAKEIQFEPARDTSDRAVTSLVIWTFNMTLPK